MTRRPVFYLLLIAMLLQAVSLGGHWAGRGNPSETLHEVLHWSGVSHHHEHQRRLAAEDERAFELLAAQLGLPSAAPHDVDRPADHGDHDNAYHQDQSVDSNHHMALDACLSAMGPIPAGVDSPAVHAACAAPAVEPDAPPADPDLSGPRRPPKSFA